MGSSPSPGGLTVQTVFDAYCALQVKVWPPSASNKRLLLAAVHARAHGTDCTCMPPLSGKNWSNALQKLPNLDAIRKGAVMQSHLLQPFPYDFTVHQYVQPQARHRPCTPPALTAPIPLSLCMRAVIAG